MGILGQLTSQLGELIKSQSAARRIMVLVIVGGSLAVMVWLALFAQTGSYTVLYSNLSAQDANEARMKLVQMGIQSKLENGGTVLKVPTRRADDAAMMLAMEGIPSNGMVGFELMDKTSIGQSKFQQEKNYQRMREGELARTLLTLQEIERARVHLAVPEDSLFVKDEKRPTASVVVKLRRGATLTDRQINGIIHLVSHGIEGLSPDDVSIIDQAGNLLNASRESQETMVSATQATYKMNYEEYVKTRVESLLENIVGKGRVSARVQADFDFSRKRQVSEKYNPDDQDQMIRSEQVSSERRPEANSLGTQGPAGSDSNLPQGKGSEAGGSSATAGGAMRTEQTRDYALSREWKETEDNVPMPMRISVALLVDGNYSEVTGGDGKKTMEFQPRSAEEISKYEELVKAAIGFTSTDTRQDVVTVECLPFKIEEQDVEKAPWLTFQMRQMIELGVTWTVVGLIGLLLIFTVLRPAVKQILVARAPVEGALLTSPEAARAALGQIREGYTQAEIEVPEGLTPEEAEEYRKAMSASSAFQQLQQMNHMQHKAVTEQAEEVHREVLESVKENPQRTVSLLRQWMDEA